MKKNLFNIVFNLIVATSANSQELPIIDMHLHAFFNNDSDVLIDYEKQTIEALKSYNIIAVTSSNQHKNVMKWKSLLPDRLIPAHSFMDPESINLDSIVVWHKTGNLRVLGEVNTQYKGILPNNKLMEPIWRLADSLKIPVGIHMGPGPSGAAYGFSPDYRAVNSNPLLLEEILVRHPKLKVYVMHAGWPFISEMIAVLQAHPQVYVDIGVINWDIPKEEFYHYLKRLINAGYGNRIMFGSDQVRWPEMIEVAIGRIQSADFLTEKQKRDIFYNNAAQFLGLTDEQIEKHHEIKATNKR